MDKELQELEKEFLNKLKGSNVPVPNKNWIPKKEFMKQQLQKKKYKALKNIDIKLLIEFENDLIKEQEREIKQKLKQVNKSSKKLGMKKLKINKTIKSFEYLINVRIFKLYDDIENKKVKHHWQFQTDSAESKYVIFRMFTSYKIKPSDLDFLKYTIGKFYNKHDNTEIVHAFGKVFQDSFELNNIKDDAILYFDGFIIDNTVKLEVNKYKKPKLKDIKYKNDVEKGIYSPYTNYTINPNAKLFQDVFDINYNDYLKNNYRPNSCLLTCIINKFYDRFNDTFGDGKRRYKHNLTYSHLCKLLNIEDKPDNIGASINDVMPFFENYKLGFVVYNQYMKEVHTYKPEKLPTKYQVLKILIKDSHVYELNDRLLSLKKINISENIKVSNKYYINDNEESTVNKFKFILSNGLKDIISYVKTFNNRRNLFNKISKDKLNSVIKILFISNDDINDLLIEIVNNKYVPKVFYNNYVYKIDLKIDHLFISIESVDVSTQSEPSININSIDEHDKFLSIDKSFKSNFIKNDYLSIHHESVINIEDKYKLNAISGHLYNTPNTVCGLDIRKAYSSFLSNINVIPIFSYFDVYKKYNNESIENYTYYIIEILDCENNKSTLIFNEKISRVYGFVLNQLDEDIKYKIHYYRKPFKLEEVDFKTPVHELYNNDSIDSDLKKYIANKLTGILELKRNKSHISKIYNDYDHAKYFQKLYGGKIIPINKTISVNQNKRSDFDDDIIDSVQYTSETQFYLLNVEKQERLINGFTPIKDIIYCIQKVKILQIYNKMISLKLKVVGIKTDCVFYEGKNEIIKQHFDLSNAVGNFKIETGKYMMDSKLFIKDNDLIEFIDFDNIKVKTFDDEYNNKEINKYLIQNKRVMIKSLFPGSGKSQSIKNLGLKTLFILPENKLAQDILNEKNENINAITFSKLFGLYANDIELEKNKAFDLTDYEAIFFDEICKHSPERLKRIAYFIINNPKLLVFGGGDFKQIAPINYEGNTKYLDDCLNIIFPNQILFKEIKRIADDKEKETIKGIYKYIFETNNEKIDIVNLCKKFNIKMVNNLSEVNTKMNLAYFNSRCHNISSYINKSILKNKDDYNIGQNVVCRKYYKNKGMTLNTNYTYKILSFAKGLYKIKDETNNIVYDITTSLLHNNFILEYCRTIDSQQGASVSEKMTIFDLNIPYVTKEHIWVAITRNRSLKNLQIFIHPDNEVKSYTFARIKQYFTMKVHNYKKQDEKAKRIFKVEDYIDEDFIFQQQKKTNNKCTYCLKDLEIFIDNDNKVKSDLTIDRIDNGLAHIKTNCKICCLTCNVSKK